jgi:hypothetical protein
MLRQTVLLVGIVAAGCVLGDGVDLPSTGTGPMDGGLTADGGIDSSDGANEGPPTPGAPTGTGGTPCCTPPNVAGLGGGGAGGSTVESGP